MLGSSSLGSPDVDTSAASSQRHLVHWDEMSRPSGQNQTHESGIEEQISASEAAVMVIPMEVMTHEDHSAAGPPE